MVNNYFNAKFTFRRLRKQRQASIKMMRVINLGYYPCNGNTTRPQPPAAVNL
jgi:hypothetical protein